MVLGDTTSSALNLTMAHVHYQQLEFVVQRYGHQSLALDGFPSELFARAIEIGHLRVQATKSGELSSREENPTEEAYDVLQSIHAFSPELWGESKNQSTRDWTLIGRIYQAATALYCISSLQSVSVLPPAGFLRDRCVTCGKILHHLLDEGLSLPRLERFLLWPLIILGTQAVDSGYGVGGGGDDDDDNTARRTFVQEKLIQVSQRFGVSGPLVAKEVLERFWASGKSSWDDCFDKPYVFTTQIALNVGSLG